MTTEIDSAAKALRGHIRTALGLTGDVDLIPESGGLSVALTSLPDEFLATELAVETRPHTPAVRDTTNICTMTVYYVRRRLEGEEDMSVVRARLDEVEGAAMEATTWGAGLAGLVAVETTVSGLSIGGQDRYSQFFAGDDTPRAAGSIAVSFTVIT